MTSQSPLSVIQFWRDEVGAPHWFGDDPKLDARIRARYEALWSAARTGARDAWLATPKGALALVIVLDQFPRNMFRGQGQAFATDPNARAAAKRALDAGFDWRVPTALRVFFYLPFMHSEDMADQDACVALIAERLGKSSSNYPYALGHREQIARFGRFPGRNIALGRAPTPQDTVFLNAG